MKKIFCAMVVLLATAAWTQTGSSSGTGKGQTSDATKKGTSITGCLSGPNDEGAYELTPKGSSKKVEVGGSDELSKHVGNEVRLHGAWAKSGSEIGEKEGAEQKSEKDEKSEKGEKESAERHFKVTSIDHIADTCPAAGKSGGQKGSGKPSPSPHPGSQL